METDLSVIPGKTDISDKPEYDVNKLSRDFPQIFKRGNAVRKSPAFKKYALREAMRKLEAVKADMTYTEEMSEGCELSFVTNVSLITIKGEAARAIRQHPEFLYDFIDAGWEFYFVGC